MDTLYWWYTDTVTPREDTMMKGSTMEMTREQIDKAVEGMTYRSAKRLADQVVDEWTIGTDPDVYAAEYKTPEGDLLYVESTDRGPERARFHYADRVLFFRRCGSIMTRATEYSYRFGWGSPARRTAMLDA